MAQNTTAPNRPKEYKKHDQKTKYMTFQLVARKPKTTVWNVINNKSGFLLGGIEWYGPWRQYVLGTYGECIFNNSCLDDISKFLTELNNKQKGGE